MAREPRPAQTERGATRMPMLDVLRGLMALAVCVYHLSMWTHLFGPATRAGTTATLLGIYSVEGFFVISGVCFFHQYGHVKFDGPSFGRFYARRFLRLLPLYYLAVALNLSFSQEVGAFSWRKLFENLTLMFGFFHPNHAMVLGGWSVGIEVTFYVAFPFLIWLARRPAALGAVTVILTCTAIPWTFGKVEAASDWGRFHAYVEVPNQAFLFLWGAVIAQLRGRTSLRITPTTFAILGCGTLLLVLSSQPIVGDHIEAMVGFVRVKYLVIVLAFVLLAALTQAGQRGRASQGLSWLGDASYALYLLHPFAWLWMRSILGDRAVSPFGFAASLLLGLLLAFVAHRLIERPILAWGRRHFSPQSFVTRKPTSSPRFARADTLPFPP